MLNTLHFQWSLSELSLNDSTSEDHFRSLQVSCWFLYYPFNFLGKTQLGKTGFLDNLCSLRSKNWTVFTTAPSQTKRDYDFKLNQTYVLFKKLKNKYSFSTNFVSQYFLSKGREFAFTKFQWKNLFKNFMFELFFQCSKHFQTNTLFTAFFL